MVCPCVNGPAVVSVFVIETSAEEEMAVPPLPVLSVLFARFGSNSAGVAVALLSKMPAATMVGLTLVVGLARFVSASPAVAVALLSNAPAAVIVAVTLIVVFAPLASEAIVHGSAVQAPETVPSVRFVGVSVT